MADDTEDEQVEETQDDNQYGGGDEDVDAVEQTEMRGEDGDEESDEE